MIIYFCVFLQFESRSNETIVVHKKMLGGAYKSIVQEDFCLDQSLKLKNPGTNCFVNSVIQMMRRTEYAEFLKHHLNTVDIGSQNKRFKVSYSLHQILMQEGNNDSISTSLIRSLVASESGKPYLDEGRQEDAAEFLGALESTLSNELKDCPIYLSFKDKHWGHTQIVRKFQGGSSNGGCASCGLSPETKQDPFFIFELRIPKSGRPVKLSEIIENHFQQSKVLMKMRCSSCCELQKHPSSCPRTGCCEDRDVIEQTNLSKTPDIFFIQLMRNVYNHPKIRTFVEIEDEVLLPNGSKLEPIAIIDHIGATPRSGHYVTYLKSTPDKWIRYDDENCRQCTLKDANSELNHLMLFKKKTGKILAPSLNAEVKKHKAICVSSKELQDSRNDILVNKFNSKSSVEEKNSKDESNMFVKVKKPNKQPTYCEIASKSINVSYQKASSELAEHQNERRSKSLLETSKSAFPIEPIVTLNTERFYGDFDIDKIQNKKVSERSIDEKRALANYRQTQKRKKVSSEPPTRLDNQNKSNINSDQVYNGVNIDNILSKRSCDRTANEELLEKSRTKRKGSSKSKQKRYSTDSGYYK